MVLTRSRAVVRRKLCDALYNDHADVFYANLPSENDASTLDYMLSMAARWKRDYAVQWLLEKGADPNKRCLERTVLHYSMYDATIMQTILGYGADPNIEDVFQNWETPIFEALRRTDGALVRLLLVYGADPNRRNKLGYTPVMYALRYGEWYIALYLMAMGGRVNHEINIISDLHHAFLVFVHNEKRVQFYKFCLYIYGTKFSTRLIIQNMFLMNTPSQMDEMIRCREYGLTLQETADYGLRLAKARQDILNERKKLNQQK